MSKQAKKIAPAPPTVLKPTLPERFEDHRMWHIVILLVVTFFIYIKAAGFELIHMEDMAILQNNAYQLAHWQTIGLAFQTDVFLNKFTATYHPVQTVSFMIDTMIGTGHPWFYHLSSILYHLLTVLSLYALLRKLNIKNVPSFVLSFFFALHPLLTGAVCWVPARADILVGLWSILALGTFIDYIKTGKQKYLALHLLLFALAIFSKETAALLPVLFLLFAYWLLKEDFTSKKITPVAIGWLFIIIVFFYLRSKAIATDLPENYFGVTAFFDNIMVLPILFAKAFFPANLSPMPLLETSFATIGCILLLFFVTITIIKFRNGQPLPLIGLLWFILLVAACMPFQMKDSKFLQAYSEQEAYLPLIGLTILLAWLINEQLRQRSAFYISIACLAALAFIPITAVYADSYKNSNLYFGRAADLNNAGAYTKRGEEYLSSSPKDYPDALADFKSAIESSAGEYAPAYYDLGRATSDYLKNHQDAESDFTQAILLDSTQIDPYIDRASERLLLRNMNGAITDLDKAVSIDSTSARAFYTYGKVYIAARDFRSAAEKLSTAVRLDNGYTEAYTDRALVYYQLNDYPDAIKDCNKAITLNGAFFTAYYNKAMVYYAMNKMDTTVKLLDSTLALADNFYFGYFYRGMAKKQLHDMKGACSDWQEAASLGFTMAEDTIKRYCK